MTTTTRERPLSPACDVRLGPDDPGRPQRRLPTALRVALAVPMMLAAALSPGILAVIPNIDAWADAQPDSVAVAFMYAMYAIATITALLLVWLAMRFLDRRPLPEAGLRMNSRSLPSLVLAMAVTVPSALLVGWVTQSMGLLRPVDVGALTGGHPLWVVVAIWLAQAFLLQGIPEEIVWRGYVLQTLQTRPEVSVYISAAVFAICHLTSKGGQQSAWEHVAYLAIPFGFAVLAGALMLRTGSLWAAIGVHGGFHAATMIGTLWMGVGEGPAFWLAVGAVHTVIGMALLHRRSR